MWNDFMKFATIDIDGLPFGASFALGGKEAHIVERGAFFMR